MTCGSFGGGGGDEGRCWTGGRDEEQHNSFKSENYLVDQQLQNIQREASEIYSNTVQIQPELIPE